MTDDQQMNTEPQPTNRIASGIAIALVCGLAIAGAFYFSFFKTIQKENLETVETVSLTNTFGSIELEAHAAYVYDARNDRELFSKNGDTALPLASLTKIMTALVAVSDLPDAREVPISESAIATQGDSGLIAGERWAIDELASFMLVVSSNDAATALREAYEASTGGSFIAAMNKRAQTIGLTRAIFVNETGLDEGFGRETNSGSPYDMAILFAHALAKEPRLFEETRTESTVFTSLSGRRHVTESTNLIANNIPWSIGAKTGFTDSAGGNLAVAFDASVGRPIIVVVMGSSREGRFSDMQTLIKATLKARDY